jgi:hypothetical protein
VTRSDGRPCAGEILLATRPADPAAGKGVNTNLTADPDGWVTWRRSLPGRYSIEVSVVDVGRGTVGRGTTDVDVTLGETSCSVVLK